MSRWTASFERHPHLLGLVTVILLTLAAAPFGQWYLAWIALTPWLIAIARAPTLKSAFARGWITGIVYFALNEWWLWTATVSGTIGVVVCSGFYWGLAAAFIYYLRLLPRAANYASSPLDPKLSQPFALLTRIVGIAVVWVAAEWLRCNTVSEFPWLPIGSTQSPAIVICQIADLSGIWGISFLVVLVNALLATAWLVDFNTKRLLLPSSAVALVLLAVAAYGIWRLNSTPERPGPRIMLVQSNHPHLPGGASTTTPEKAAEYFLDEIEKQLALEPADLVILPENEFPPLNDEARAVLRPSPVGPALESFYQRLIAIARKHNATLLVGGAAVTDWRTVGKEHIGSVRNSAYFFTPSSQPVGRYDKIQLVPFSERLPFASGPEWLTNCALFLAANRAVQPLHAGTFDHFQPFVLNYSASPSTQSQVRVATPICLENIDPIMSARMVRDPTSGRKRVDFFANLSNDGWFHDQEKFQHWQLLTFRCIENRVPMARCSNTGISGFIDSCGRATQSTALDQPATAFGGLSLDDRESFYLNHPDIFPIACVFAIAIATIAQTAMGLGRVAGVRTPK
jgi:apolipoprotein N-acyltransferase